MLKKWTINKSIYSDSGWDTSGSNVRLEESNYNEGQSIYVPLDVHASVFNPLSQKYFVWLYISTEYLLGDNQRVVDFLEAGTQEDKQRFIDLLHAKIDREWEARKALSQARRTLRRPDIYA